MPPPQHKPYTDFQIQVLLERILRRPLWRVLREGLDYRVWTTADESPVAIPWKEIADSMTPAGNIRASADLQRRLIEFQNRGIPDKDGHDISGRVTPPPSTPRTGLGSVFRSIFGKKPGRNGNGGA
jgi:hypothetical protein